MSDTNAGLPALDVTEDMIFAAYTERFRPLHSYSWSEDEWRENYEITHHKENSAVYRRAVSDAKLHERERQLADALRRLAEVEAANRWIPCSERIPEEFMYCEIVLRGSVCEGFTHMWADEPRWTATREPSKSHLHGDVTHWRPLPPAPTEVQP